MPHNGGKGGTCEKAVRFGKGRSGRGEVGLYRDFKIKRSVWSRRPFLGWPRRNEFQGVAKTQIISWGCDGGSSDGVSELQGGFGEEVNFQSLERTFCGMGLGDGGCS